VAESSVRLAARARAEKGPGQWFRPYDPD